jgi:hypothetical protein
VRSIIVLLVAVLRLAADDEPCQFRVNNEETWGCSR